MKLSKWIGRDDKSITISNSMISNSFNSNTTIHVFRNAKRWWNRTFLKEKYFNDLKNKFSYQLRTKVETQKQNKKYIPNVFLELNEVKEELRILVQPHLFYQKCIEELKRVDFIFFNEIYRKINLPPMYLEIDDYGVTRNDFESLELEQQSLSKYLNKFLSTLPNLEDRESFEKNLDEENYKILVKEYGTSRRIKWIIDDFKKDLEIIGQKKIILLTEKAGQGKTNLICDFVENVILRKGLYGVFLTGNEFTNLHRDRIEAVILKSIFGFQNDITFDEFLEDINVLCNHNQTTFTIVIDGLNENSNIEMFSKELHDFVGKTLQYKFIRFIFTCRSEYFEDRFKEFLEPSFHEQMFLNKHYLNSIQGHRDELPDYLEKRLIDSYFDFFQVKNSVHDNVKHELANNFLLLRIFCEVYGVKNNDNVPIEQVYSIYKEDLFSHYYRNKIGGIQSRQKYSTTEFQQIFQIILAYMVENKQFMNIPFQSIPELNQELLNEIIFEDILFRKDLITDEKSVFANQEVLNFTFDEFRDYLIADYLVHSKIDIINFLNNLPEKDSSLEGVENYLFFKSRKEKYRERLQRLETLPHFDNIFIDNIFAVNDDDINNADIEKIQAMFLSGAENSKHIIHFLMFRYRTQHYKKLNINTLLKIITSLKDEEYDRLICPMFDIERDRYSYHRNRSGILLEVINQIEAILKEKNFVDYPEYHNIVEFMILLLGVKDNDTYETPYELIELLKIYIGKYPNNAKEYLIKYLHVQHSRVQSEILWLLKYMIEEDHIELLKKDFFNDTFESLNADENLQHVKESLLREVYGKSPIVLNEEAIKYFKNLKLENESWINKLLEGYRHDR
ncbi:MAG: NACHT domain-containing NTPase [Sulfuricurvum sp.]